MPGSLFDAVLVRPSFPAGDKSDALHLPSMKQGAGGVVVPDYAAWCAGYFQGCFACPDFLRDKVRFCRKWNRTFHGADVVDL